MALQSIDELTNELIELETKKRSFIGCDKNAEYEFNDFLDYSGEYSDYKIFHLEFAPSKILKMLDPMAYKDLNYKWCLNQLPWINEEIVRLTEELSKHNKVVEDAWVEVIPKKEYDNALENSLRSEFLIGDSSYFIQNECLYIEIEEYSFYVCCPDIPKDFSYEEVEVFIEQIKEGISN